MLATSERDSRDESVMQGHSAMFRVTSRVRMRSSPNVWPLQDSVFSADFLQQISQQKTCFVRGTKTDQGLASHLMRGHRSSFRCRRLTAEERAATPRSFSSGKQLRSRLTRPVFCDSDTIPAEHSHMLSRHHCRLQQTEATCTHVMQVCEPWDLTPA